MDEATRTERALLALRGLSVSLQSTLEVDDILDGLVRAAVAMAGAEGGIAALCASDGLSGFRRIAGGQLATPDSHWSPGDPIPGRILTTPLPHLCNDVGNDPAVDAQLAARYGVTSLIGTPIHDAGGQMIGFLELHNKKDGTGFTRFDQDQLASAAQIAALAARNAHAFRTVSAIGAKLRESTERYRELVEGLDAIVWEAEVDPFRFTFVSRRAEELLGYPVSQWLEEPDFWVRHLHPGDRERVVGICRQTAAEGRDRRFRYRFLAAGGAEIWLRDHARVVRGERGATLRGVMVDVTEAMANEELLRRSEERFRSIFEGAGIGIAIVDRQGKILHGNPALREMFGNEDQQWETVGLGLDGARFASLVDGNLGRYQEEKLFRGTGGRELWVRLTVSAVQEDCCVHYAIVMLEDVTGRCRAEAEVAQLLARVQSDAAGLEVRVAERTAQLEEINSELDSFAHSVSHDLRAPLRAMRGFAEILLEDGTLDESQRIEYLGRILSAAQGMDLLIQDLLAYSRLSRQEIQLETVSLSQVVAEALRQLDLVAGGKQYRLEVRGELPEVAGHPTVLVQVLLNLLTNAIKFVPGGVHPRLRISAEQGERYCRLYVEDNGIGIPAEHQERIFNIFERLHPIESYPGTGVGLAIVRRAVNRLGGRIGVESRAGEGSRFWIELPRAAKAPLLVATPDPLAARTKPAK
ncbi:PAS domain S-box protein [Geomonas sp. Red32]|uniref:ATP-binding protein n=1 Tax=Geomonas sp. Red32 TaxID=2912856 RepID=UPI00202CC906|nr:ATP-binding protein [Geomonas sp. Red32]MCM0081515.1 PAS domain S-box protein [Geomonas sp. Red32]